MTTMFDELAASISEPHFVGSSAVPTRRGLGHREFHALLRDHLLAAPADVGEIVARLARAIPGAYGFVTMPRRVATDLAGQHVRLAFARRDLPEPAPELLTRDQDRQQPKPLDRPGRRAAILAHAEGAAAGAAEAAAAARAEAEKERLRQWAQDRRRMPDPRQVKRRYR